MEMVTAAATLPFLLHIGSSIVILLGLEFSSIQKDSPGWWMDSMVESYRLGPRTDPAASYITCIQLALACAAMVLHFLEGLQWRRYSYAILLSLYAVTQLRHIMYDEGKNIIGYLYLNIAMFTILVLYNDFLYNRKLSKQ